MVLTKFPDCGRTISDLLDVCPGCGYRPDGRNFYPGKPASTAIPVRCPWCGEMVPAGKKNCPGCGSPAKVSYSMTPQRLKPVELDYTPFSVEENPTKKRRSMGRTLLIAALLAALLAFVVVRIETAVRRNAAPSVPEPTVQANAVPSQN